ncbi:MAG: hypothetical protein ABIR32_16765 [Ilumatobacteraceae bacterium]
MRFPARRSGSSVAVALAATGTVLAGLVVAGCGDAPTRSAERFCGELTAHLTEIQTGPESADAIPAFIVLFSKMGEAAPLDVQEDWEAIYTNLKTANTVDPNDPASLQAVSDSAIAQQQSYINVAAWAQKTCGLDIGPVGTVAGGADVATTTTSSPGTETTISGG